MSEVHIEYPGKRYGILHSSGKNRTERRAEAGKERLKPETDRKAKWQDHLELQRDQRAAKVARKQGAAHARAEERKAAAKGIKPSLAKRALAAIREAKRRREEKKRRAEKHAQKVARQQQKAV